MDVAVVRLKLLRVEISEDQLPQECQLNDLTCSVNVKEIEINGEGREGHSWRGIVWIWTGQECIVLFLICRGKSANPKEEDHAVGGKNALMLASPNRVLQVLVQHEKALVADATLRLEVGRGQKIYTTYVN
jgi:hypothetical protein